MSAAGRSAGASAPTTTSAQRLASAGSSRSDRTLITCIGAPARTSSSTCSARSSRSSSAMSTFGRESVRPYDISVGVHQAFMPTTAAPIEIVAQ